MQTVTNATLDHESRTTHTVAACQGVSDARLEALIKAGGLDALLATIDELAIAATRLARGDHGSRTQACTAEQLAITLAEISKLTGGTK